MGSAGPQFDIWSNYLNVIDGKTSGTSETRNGVNPANGKANPQVPVSTQQDVDAAVDAGRKAFKSWSQTPWAERTKAVLAYADAVDQHAEDFAKLLTQEQGKPVSGTWVQNHP
jgi:acyl-CoA reductase-like NAD-dependent aldehyde dehydrogenase